MVKPLPIHVQLICLPRGRGGIVSGRYVVRGAPFVAGEVGVVLRRLELHALPLLRRHLVNSAGNGDELRYRQRATDRDHLIVGDPRRQ